MNLKDFFESEKIYEYSLLDMSDVTVIDNRRAQRLFDGTQCKTVAVFLMPYYIKSSEPSNISVYAHSRDYHEYFTQLTDRAKATFGDVCAGACDTSPINEVEAAVKAGLGSIGRNGLIINERYGTYVFVGEFYFSLPSSHSLFDSIRKRAKGSLCNGCGACERACPTNALQDKTRCISYINQKKKLSEGDADIISSSGSVWGCDVCQNACPLNKKADETQIRFFKEDRTPYLTQSVIDRQIKDGTFSRRAYAWRGEAVVRRNIDLCKKK